MRSFRSLIGSYLVGISLQTLGWFLLAPDAICFVQEGACVWQMDQTSSPYFYADLIFGGFGIVGGLVIGWHFAHDLQPSPKLQAIAALMGLSLGWLATSAVALLSDVQLTANSLGVDGLSLRATSMLFVLPLVVQLLVVFRNPKQSVSVSEPSADSFEL